MTWAAAIVAIVAALVGALLGGLLGLRAVSVADRLQQAREERQREVEGKLLARSLRAELEGVAQNWLSASKAYRESGGLKPILVGTEPRFPIFDGVGRHLSLLPADIVDEAVRCYTEMKDAYDMSRHVSADLVPQCLALPENRKAEAAQTILAAYERTAKRGDRAAELMTDLSKKLEEFVGDA